MDIGSGSGFISAVMAFMVQDNSLINTDFSISGSKGSDSNNINKGGYVCGVDIVKEAIDFSIQVMKTKYPHLQCEFICDNGWTSEGAESDENLISEKHSFYDVIHVGAEGILLNTNTF